MGFNTSSVWIKVALICLILATLLFVIGFATVSWMTQDSGRNFSSDDWGLWNRKQCIGNHCKTHKITTAGLKYSGWEDWYRATQAFECIGLICLALALLIILLFVFVDSMRKRSPLIAIIVLSFVAVLAMVIGFLIFGLKFDDYAYGVGWSMGLAIGASILTFVAGIMALIDLKK